jgi:hypothetical protein
MTATMPRTTYSRGMPKTYVVRDIELRVVCRALTLGSAF